MNENQVGGVTKKVKGAIKEGTSKATGNTLGQSNAAQLDGVAPEAEVGSARKGKFASSNSASGVGEAVCSSMSHPGQVTFAPAGIWWWTRKSL